MDSSSSSNSSINSSFNSSINSSSNSSSSMCDESKCVSTGMSHAYNGSHTCYGDDAATNPKSYHPMMCADGYLPRVVGLVGDNNNNNSDGEDNDNDNDTLGEVTVLVPTTTADGTRTTNVTVRYFTCCPPIAMRYSHRSNNNNNSLIDDTSIGIEQKRRHCSDPIWMDETAETTDTDTLSEPAVEVTNVCHEEDHISQGRTYPRRMKSYRTGLAWMKEIYIISEDNYFICCDYDHFGNFGNSFDHQEQEQEALLDNGNSNGNSNNTYLEDTACVPYHNQWYEVAQSQNRMGRLSAISCDVEKFLIPRPIIVIPLDNNDSSENTVPTDTTTTAILQRYQCCHTGSAMPPFVNDAMFRINVYVPLTLYLIAALLLTTIVTSLLVPFFMELVDTAKKKKKRKTTTHENNNSNNNRRRRGRQRTKNSTASNAQKYSTYNLYIIYLLLPDLAYTLCLIGFSLENIQQHFDPTFYTMLVWPAGTLKKNYEEIYLLLPYVIANSWINGIISYRVVSLLKASKSVQRITQPSPYRVTLDACAVYSLVGVSVLGFHYLEKKINFIYCWLVFITLVIPPCSYILYAPMMVWWNNYLPPLATISREEGSSSTEQLRNRAIRELALYFFRIITAYCVTVLPGIFFWMYGYVQIGQATKGGSGSDWGIFALTVFFMLQMIVSSGFVLTKSDVRKYVWELVTLSYVFGKKNVVPKNVVTTIKPSSKQKKKQPLTPPSLRFDKKNQKDKSQSKLGPVAASNPSSSELDPTSSQTTSKTSRVDSSTPQHDDDDVPLGAEMASGMDENDNDANALALNAVEAGMDADNDDAACALNAAEGCSDEESDDDDLECLISSLFGVHRPPERSVGDEAAGTPPENCTGEAKTELE